MKRAFRNMTIADRMLFLILIVVSCAGMVYTREALSQGTDVVIEVGGRAVFATSLDIDGEIPVEGMHGRAIVEIRNGKVRIKEAGCDNHICMKQGWIAQGAIVCLPNSIVITTGSGLNKDVDAITG